jgi:hypothetical protein
VADRPPLFDSFRLCSHAGMRLRDYPYIVLRIACRECPRIGRYRLAVLAERFGADAETHDVVETISASCSARIDPKRGLRCGAYLPDVPPPRPPDLPRSVLPRERLRLIRGARG